MRNDHWTGSPRDFRSERPEQGNRPPGVEVVVLPRTTWISPREIVTALRGLGLKRILIEGGAITIARFLEANLLTRLHVAIAPLLIGAGPQGLTTSPVASLAQARRPDTRVFSLGSDVLFDCALLPERTPKCLCAGVGRRAAALPAE